MSSPRKSPYLNEEYTVGWICALPVELAAARGMIDGEDHKEPQTSPAAADQNRYTLGTIGNFKVIIASLPKDQLGSSSATASVKDMLFTFPKTRIGLCVGIGAGIPDYDSQDEHDVRLGDVVISSSSKTGGVVAYDLGKRLADGSFETRSALAPPPRSLSSALAAMQAQHEMEENKIPFYVGQMIEKHPFMRKKGYTKPESDLDRFFKADYIHVGGNKCSKCEDSEAIERENRFDEAPLIHYGTIASGNMVVKDSILRDEIRDKHGALCLEMEAAGLMNNFPCVVIRGISDYADSHKNDRWQPYAAAVAAACAKEYLEHVQVKDVDGEPTVKAILEKVQEVHTEVTKVGKFVATKETKQVLDWISSVDFIDQQNDNISLRQEGTGSWLINSEEFTQWMNGNSEHRTLFCPGIPGSGKTLMASIVIEHSRETFKDNSDIKVAFEFCSYQSKHRQTKSELLLSLLRQLALRSPDADLLPCVLKLFQTHSSQSTRPQPLEVEAVIKDAIGSYSSVFLVVDALDEYYSADREDSRLFFEALRKIREHTHVKVFVTSRYNEDISSHFVPFVTKEIRAHDDDILKYVKERMPQLRISKTSQTLEFQEHVQGGVIKAADGVFLLAKLHMNHLMDFLTIKRVKSAITQLPRGTTGLKLAYDQAMLRITSQSGGESDEESEGEGSASELALKALSWLTFSKTALTADQLIHAIVTRPGMKNLDWEAFVDINVIESICAGLVAFDRNTGIVRLVHYTTKTYLSKSSYLQDSGEKMAKVIITYLSFHAFSTGRCSAESSFVLREERYPLLTYCALYWGAHVSTLIKRSPDLFALCVRFLELEMNVQAASQAMIIELYHYFQQNPLRRKRIPWSISFGLTKIHLACYFNLDMLLAHYLSRDEDVNIKDSMGKVPIVWAIENGHVESARVLLESCRINPDVRDIGGKSLLMYAAAGRYVQIAELVILHGASPDIRDNMGRSALAYAAITGQIAMIKLLVSQKVEINYSHEPKAKEYLDDSSMADSLLNAADALEQHGPIFLFDRVADPVGTPLIDTVSSIHTEAAVLLLDHGADPNFENSEGDTPLSAAVARRSEELVNILLERGATLEASPSTLCYAIEAGDSKIVRRFLEAGADPNFKYLPSSLQRSDDYVNSLEPVSLEEMMTMFSPGALSTNLIFVPETALFRATRLGHSDVVYELLSYGADPNQRNGKEETPLFVASKIGNTQVAQLLLEQDIAGNTPLFGAVESGSVETVKLLLSKGADVFQTNAIHETALFGATKHLSPELCELLLAQGADPDAMNLLQCTPLFKIAQDVCLITSSAAKHFIPGDHDYEVFVKIATLLIEHGANPSPQQFHPELEEVRECLQMFIAMCSQPLSPDQRPPELAMLARGLWGEKLSSFTDERVYTFLELVCLGRKKIESCGESPFYWISAMGNCDLVSRVLEENLAIKAENSGLLQGAVASTNVDMAELVLNALGEEVLAAQSLSDLLAAPARDGNLNMFRLIFKRLFSPESSIGYSLFLAVTSGNTDLVDFILANVNDPPLVGKTGLNVLHWAVLSKSPAMVQFLLEHKLLENIDINAKDDLRLSPLHCVTQLRHENTPIAKLFLERGADPNSTDTPMLEPEEPLEPEESASNSGDHSQDLDLKDLGLENLSIQEKYYHWNLLAFAAHNGAVDLLEVLLEYKADSDPRNQFGVRPICLAALDGHESIVRILLDNNVNPNQVEGSSEAPLTWALRRHMDVYRHDSSRISDWPGSKAVEGTVNILLQRGADPNPADGSTPILAALSLYAEDLVLLLLKAGSSPHCRDAYERTPLIIATALGMKRAVAALLEIPDAYTDPETKDIYAPAQTLELL
ncbi:hypothetical protein N7466_000801 [Penicillium verhagenii]|uniref:uncharacterized protein n=1 Tax=Penicillium verhagenii TaxID=1562060 RepID=UPI00254537BC|nr:uncharacterized protein N7466_000801 [Penicillium verhagenii]KAJ5947786.1 hypothetical protein N7466_000801 [Penicillium verhagenii]